MDLMTVKVFMFTEKIDLYLMVVGLIFYPKMTSTSSVRCGSRFWGETPGESSTKVQAIYSVPCAILTTTVAPRANGHSSD